MLWEKNGSSFEIRTQGELPDGRPALDEIVASGATIHLEQMAHDAWFMEIEAGGKYFHLNFALADGQLQVNLSDQGEEASVHALVFAAIQVSRWIVLNNSRGIV
jgi:hypothetical protein